MGQAAVCRSDVAIETLHKADLHLQQSGEAIFSSLVEHVRGVVLAHEGRVAEAEFAFKSAINVARSQSALMLAFGAAIDCAELLRAQGQAAEAPAVLAGLACSVEEHFAVPHAADNGEGWVSLGVLFGDIRRKHQSVSSALEEVT
ncbi:MAG: hypothetical protein JOY71_04320 [Acetobacteraceae bacterium]|nr:hypothetical protein [Acetobacteraceae bacterium]